MHDRVLASLVTGLAMVLVSCKHDEPPPKDPDTVAIPTAELSERLRATLKPRPGTTDITSLFPQLPTPPTSENTKKLTAFTSLSDRGSLLAALAKAKPFAPDVTWHIASGDAYALKGTSSPGPAEDAVGSLYPTTTSALPSEPDESNEPPLCYFGEVPSSTALSLDADVKEYKPEWARLPPLLVASLACGSANENCLPRVLRNDKIANAEFRKGTIRFSWPFMERQAAALNLDPNSYYFSIFFIGVIAHEYGHFLDQVVFESMASKGVARQLEPSFPGADIQSWDRELWADSVAGCLLGRMHLSPKSLTYSIQGLSGAGSTSHPPGAARAEAIEASWTRCSHEEPPNSFRDLLTK